MSDRSFLNRKECNQGQVLSICYLSQMLTPRAAGLSMAVMFVADGDAGMHWIASRSVNMSGFG